MKTLTRFFTVKMRFLFHPFTSRKFLSVCHKIQYYSSKLNASPHCHRDVYTEYLINVLQCNFFRICFLNDVDMILI